MKQKLSSAWKNYSFAFIFAAIFLFYVLASTGLTWGGVTNILRHSAVIGIVAQKMHSLIDDTIKGVILIAAILVQTAGPQLKTRLSRK